MDLPPISIPRGTKSISEWLLTLDDIRKLEFFNIEDWI